ncbi:B12-binding domain-containing radical SAM protein [Streptomyces sp. S1A1-8]|nr:B12-binding domain-containing radical SAM protein [Streptomyces sp. RLB1-9]QDO19427.1 B12-binding domain-containing radical SAM protein [Streptomyces sp. S1A1-8]QDO29553.1 B12-binding domain-containing radical SAM protein [Streptomyces sp. S1A1-3]
MVTHGLRLTVAPELGQHLMGHPQPVAQLAEDGEGVAAGALVGPVEIEQHVGVKDDHARLEDPFIVCGEGAAVRSVAVEDPAAGPTPARARLGRVVLVRHAVATLPFHSSPVGRSGIVPVRRAGHEVALGQFSQASGSSPPRRPRACAGLCLWRHPRHDRCRAIPHGVNRRGRSKPGNGLVPVSTSCAKISQLRELTTPRPRKCDRECAPAHLHATLTWNMACPHAHNIRTGKRLKAGVMESSDVRHALLVAPSYDHNEYLGAESLGIRSVAAALLRESAQVAVVDECPAEPSAEIFDLARRSSLIGIGVLFTRQIPDALALAEKFRSVSPHAHITIGGQGSFSLWSRMLEECDALDSACLNEAEESVAELWRQVTAGNDLRDVRGIYLRLDEGLMFTGPRPPTEDLDGLPLPFRGGRETAYADSHVTMCTSRGCAAHCSFCQSGNYANRHPGAPRWRYRSAEHVVAEIKNLQQTYGASMFSFVDDDFLGGDSRGVQRAHEFADLIRKDGLDIKFAIECRISELEETLLMTLREVGLRHVLIGVESANDKDIRLYAKRTTPQQAADAIALLRRADIEFSVGFIMFQPLSDLDGIRTNIDFLLEHNVGSYRRVVNRLEVYPGSPLLGYFKRKQVDFRESAYRMYYDFADPQVAALYDAFVRILKPFEELENSAARALFRLRAQEGPAEIRALRRMTKVADDVTRSLLETAYQCLQAAESGSVQTAEAEITARATSRLDGMRKAFLSP